MLRDKSARGFSNSIPQTPGSVRGELLIKLAELLERDIDEISALEALDNGKTFAICRSFDVAQSAAVLRYYGGWA